MFCLICKEHLYKDITFQNLFRLNYKIHDKCLSAYNWEEEVIPIDGNVIYLITTLISETENHEMSYFFNGYRWIDYMRNHEPWSIVYFYNEECYNKLDSVTKTLLLSLGKDPLLFVNMVLLSQ